jgi:hypothetical protein
MLAKIIILIIISFLGIAGITLIYAAQYLYKEKFIKSGLREGFYNTSITDYPENKEAKKLMVAGQICIGIFIFGVVAATILYKEWSDNKPPAAIISTNQEQGKVYAPVDILFDGSKSSDLKGKN